MNQVVLIVCEFFIVLFLIITIVKIIYGISNFSRNLKYINSEINRTHGSEKEAWKRKKKRLIRKFFIFFFE